MDSLNKQLGTELLVSEDVMRDLDGFLTREAGRFRLKGKTQPVVIYELLCRLEEGEEKQKKACAVFSEALRAFKGRSWDEAREKFHQVIEDLGEDRLSHFYLKLCEEYEKNPPEEDWDGAVQLENK
jgi:adenylate cyclase